MSDNSGVGTYQHREKVLAVGWAIVMLSSIGSAVLYGVHGDYFVALIACAIPAYFAYDWRTYLGGVMGL